MYQVRGVREPRWIAADTTGRGHVTTTVSDGPFEALIIPVDA